MKTQNKHIIHKDQIIGEVYFSSHGVWVAQPNFSNFSKSFLTEEKAIQALIEHFENF